MGEETRERRGPTTEAAKEGAAWRQVVPGLPTMPTDLAFASEELGYASCVDGSVFQTVDGGETWTAEQTGTRTRLNAIKVTHDKRVLAVGEGGVVLSREGL